MIPMFRRRSAPAAHPGPAVDEAATPHAHTDADLKAAYERGRRDERARHRRSPLLALGLGVAALIGGASLALAAWQGSFREGGAMMDAGVTTAAREAVPTLRKGAAEAGEGLRKVQDRLASDPDTDQPG